jgi:hypothetical protein
MSCTPPLVPRCVDSLFPLRSANLANRKLKNASVTDSPMGLGNRRFLTQCTQKEAALVERSYGAPDRGTTPCSRPINGTMPGSLRSSPSVTRALACVTLEGQLKTSS